MTQTPAKPSSRVTAFTLDELLKHQFPPRRVIFERGGKPVLRAQDIGEIHAPRGVGKTLFAQTVALGAAAGVEVFGFQPPEASKVLFVDGEMSSEELQARFEMLAEALGISGDIQLRIVAQDWQENPFPRVDTPAGQAAISEHVDWADLIFFDNRACLFDPAGEENAEDWEPAQDYLLSLRRKGKASVLAHHGNRQGNARGLGRAEDVMNWVLKLSHPNNYKSSDGCYFTATYEKSRGFWGDAAAPFTARLHDGAWDKMTDDGSNADMEERAIKAIKILGNTAKSQNQLIEAFTGKKASKIDAVARLVDRGVLKSINLTGAIELASEIPAA